MEDVSLIHKLNIFELSMSEIKYIIVYRRSAS